MMDDAEEKRKRRRSCVVIGCNKKSSSYHKDVLARYHTFPVDPEIRQRWIDAVKIIYKSGDYWRPSNSSFVCGQHFQPNDYKDSGMLKKNTIPTVFPTYPSYLQIKNSRPRQDIKKEKLIEMNDNTSRQKKKEKVTPDAYPTINPKLSNDSSQHLSSKSEKTEKRTTIKYPRQCETCLEYFSNYYFFQKHIETHKQTASDKKACISNENSNLDYEFIENNDSNDLVMFTESEGEDEENDKTFPVAPQQQLDGEYVLGEPAFGLEDLCRVCGKCEGKMIQIYGTEGRNLDLGLKMNKCLPIKVDEGDSLPLSVCQRCVTRIEESFDLSSTCQKTDVMLTEMLAQQTMILEDQNLPTGESYPFNFDDEMLNLSRITVSESDGNLVATISVPPIDSEPFDSLSRSSSVSLDKAELFASVETDNVFQDMVQSNTLTPFSDEVKVIHCPKCEIIFSNFKHYEKHMLKSHKLYVCKNHLEFETCSKEEFKNHKKECSINQHLCSVCGKIYKSNNELTNHMRTHGERTFICEICGKSFYNKRDLKGHKKTHDPIGKFTCLLCNKHFRHRRNKLLHERTVHCKSMTYICSMCNTSYSSEIEIQVHCNLSHSPEERSKCTISVYTKKSDFQCDICQKYYSTELGVKTHRKLHTHEPKEFLQKQKSAEQYQCDFCKKYYTKRYLKIHMGIHLGVKEFVCQYCDDSFNNSTELTEHVNAVHLKTISFPCNECDKSFFSKRKLLVHTRAKHRGVEYKVDCAVCNKTFFRKHSLKVHMRVHTGERPFSCKFCGKAFTQSGYRNKHEKSMHVDK